MLHKISHHQQICTRLRESSSRLLTIIKQPLHETIEATMHMTERKSDRKTPEQEGRDECTNELRESRQDMSPAARRGNFPNAAK